jgi:small subunit ribosomal protein S16
MAGNAYRRRDVVAVVIRMKRMGRKHREFYRICATDKRSPRDGRVVEEIGTYDPRVSDTDARCTLNGERVKYWLSVGAKPSEAVAVLIRKYGPEGTHLAQMEAARARLAMPKLVPEAGEPAFIPEAPVEPAAEAAAVPEAGGATAEPSESPEASGSADAPAAEAASSEAASSETAAAPSEATAE